MHVCMYAYMHSLHAKYVLQLVSIARVLCVEPPSLPRHIAFPTDCSIFTPRFFFGGLFSSR